MSYEKKLFIFTAINPETGEEQEYSIPSVKSIPAGVIRKSRKIEDEEDRTWTILESVIGDDKKTMDALDNLTVEEFSKVIESWTGGASLGE